MLPTTAGIQTPPNPRPRRPPETALCIRQVHRIRPALRLTWNVIRPWIASSAQPGQTYRHLPRRFRRMHLLRRASPLPPQLFRRTNLPRPRVFPLRPGGKTRRHARIIPLLPRIRLRRPRRPKGRTRRPSGAPPRPLRILPSHHPPDRTMAPDPTRGASVGDRIPASPFREKTDCNRCIVAK
jgi:hypothetical protein